MRHTGPGQSLKEQLAAMPAAGEDRDFEQALVTAADAREAGIDPHRLVDMERRGTIERVHRGLYRFPLLDVAAELGQLAQAAMWADCRGVLSHDTALDVHGLCDVNLARIHITIPTSYRLQKAVPRLYAVHRRDLEKDERTLHEGIPIVTPGRAILDGIESGLRADLLRQAIDTARGRGQLRGPELARARRLLRERGRS